MRMLTHLPAKKLLQAIVLCSVVVLNITALVGAPAADAGDGGLVFTAHQDHSSNENSPSERHDDSCHFLSHHLTWVEAKYDYMGWMVEQETPQYSRENKTGLTASKFYRPPII